MNPSPIPEMINGLPNLCGWDEEVEHVTRNRESVFLRHTPMRLDRIQGAFAVALHMHQPLVLNGNDLHTAPMVGNLQCMMENLHVHGNHDAPVFAQCYSRMADFIRGLVDGGCNPRMMLDYSGSLLFGLRQMGRGDILENLKTIIHNQRYWPCVEWLGTFWGHAVASSNPAPDFILQARAWQHYFAAIFGWEALSRVRGFSPPEMHLPNHPDVCFEFVEALIECGYMWVMVQEHTVEEIDGSGLREHYLPRRLVARNSRGDEVSILALVKTQGSDTKLVAQMQPYHEARGFQPRCINGKRVPPLALQISDGENGGVMMNEFPGNYNGVWRHLGREGVVGLNGTEYLEMLLDDGLKEADFTPIQPIHQHQVWKRIKGQPSPEAVAQAIEEVKKSDHRFNMEGGSWTNNLSWVRGYDNVLDPMHRLSARFHEKVDRQKVNKHGDAYRNALFHLLTAQTSCYRYWGQGRWTEFAREICRRGMDILNHDFN